MLNPFPDLLIYSTMAPFILRMVLGFIYLDIGVLNLKKPGNMKLLGIVEVLGAVMLFLGFYTQIAAIVFIVIAGTSLYIEYKDATVLRRDIGFYLLLLAISVSLLLSGAGAYAKDLPL
jgi:uncharacterized membrane protein YphA (DoxX/SURF4 family)